MDDFKGMIVLVTGASTGLGRALVRAYSAVAVAIELEVAREDDRGGQLDMVMGWAEANGLSRSGGWAVAMERVDRRRRCRGRPRPARGS